MSAPSAGTSANPEAAEKPSRTTRRSRSGGRSARAAQAKQAAASAGNAFTKPRRNTMAGLAVVNDEALEQIHDASIHILENFGVEFMAQDARDLFVKAGGIADDETGRVRIGRDMVEAALATCPSYFELTPRNPARKLRLGENFMNFTLVAGPPSVHDEIRGRRSGGMDDYIELVKLAQSFDVVHAVGNQPTAPLELPANTRHLDTYFANLRYTDRTFHASAIGEERALDAIDMTAIARGMTREELKQDPALATVISVNSPRKVDGAMTDGLRAMAEWGQAVSITPFCLMGAMAPISVPAAVAQSNAEALICIVLTQLINPGAPVLYGSYISNVDLQSGAPAFGTPEHVQATMIAGQLARKYNLPYRASNACASNACDAQAAYESMNALWACALGGAHLIYHGAGWLEGGLQASYEKIIMDVEMAQEMVETCSPVAVNAETLALEAVGGVAPGGHYFGEAHTLAKFDSAFYKPLVSDWTNYENWLDAGGKNATQRCTEIWQQKLAEYEEPKLPEDRLEALEAFMAKRKEELKDLYI